MKEIKTLIVDDEWLIRLELKQMLQPMNHVRIVGEAATIAEAARLAELFAPDLIFLDLQLGDGSGLEFLNQTHRDFSLIYITAFECAPPGVDEHPALACLTKPINREKLLAVVQTLSTGEGVQV